MGGTDINYPQQPTYGESMRESLQAQIALAPKLYESEASQQYGRPAYAQLETDILRDTLLGQERFRPDPGQEEAIAAQQAQATTTNVAGGRYQTIYRPTGWDERTRQRQFSVDLIDPQSGETVMSKTGSFQQSDPRLGADAAGADSQAINAAMQGLFSDATDQGLMTAPEASSATQEAITGTVGRGGGLLDLLGGQGQQELTTGGIVEGDPIFDPKTGMPQIDEGGNVIRQKRMEATDRQAGYSAEGIATEADVAAGRAEKVGDQIGGDFMGLAQYGSDIAEQSARRQRGADIYDVQKYGQMASEAIKAADPLSAGLLGTMGVQATEGLAAGQDLTQREREGAIKDARTAWEARGRIRDPGAVVSELENLESARRAREAQRRAFATQTMQASRAMTADPFMAILGRPSGASQQIATQGLGGAQYGLSSGPQLYNPEAGLSNMLGQQTNQANLQAAQAGARGGLMGGLLGAGGSILGGMASGGTGFFK